MPTILCEESAMGMKEIMSKAVNDTTRDNKSNVSFTADENDYSAGTAPCKDHDLYKLNFDESSDVNKCHTAGVGTNMCDHVKCALSSSEVGVDVSRTDLLEGPLER